MSDIRYKLIIYWSAFDQAFIVEVPELAECLADGSTYQEAVANADVVIREWIETARKLGRQIPEPVGRIRFDKKAHSVEIPESHKRELDRRLAAREANLEAGSTWDEVYFRIAR